MEFQRTTNTNHFRDLLMQKRKSLALQLEELSEEAKPSPQDEFIAAQPADQVDLGTEAADKHRILATVDLEQRHLDEVNAALVRLDSGAYGICRSCKSLISDYRLELVPETTMCIDCKRVSEEESLARRKGP